VNQNVIKVWSDILKKVKNSKLILKTAKDIHTTDRIEKAFKKKVS
jgi:predicted O-linked N-acetylglucosamine transferase (SPINDLY family)